MEQLLKDLKRDLDFMNVSRTQAFLDLVLSNGDVMELLEEQLKEEGGWDNS